jgi:SAM-dependent methyltransferase
MSDFADLASAYEGVESTESFADAQALERYRASLLERSREPADFLLARLPSPAAVLEVACGNGRLLIEMARRGGLSEGSGNDLARSRIDFARRWASEAGVAGLRFEAGDVFELDLGSGVYDLACCMTGAFGYFDAFRPGSDAALVERMGAALKPGGLICLELYPHADERRLAEAGGGHVRIWRELDEDDPWRFYLSRLDFDPESSVLTHEKTFIHRASGEVDEGRRERLRLYADGEVEALLERCGFGDVESFEGFTDVPYAGGPFEVVLARLI